jgi:hypothetical protein
MTAARSRPLVHGALAVALFSAAAHAGDGPSTWSSSLRTYSGKLIAKNSYRVEVTSDYTDFDAQTRDEAEARAISSGTFETLDHAFLETVSISYGAYDQWEFGASIGYWFGTNLIRAERTSLSEATTADADPDGLTGLWLTGKYGLYAGTFGHLAGLLGLELPAGQSAEAYSDGTKLSPSTQPATDEFAWRVGIAWTYDFSERFLIDASTLYTVHTESEDYQVGDRADFGLALRWRIDADATAFPNFTLVAESLGLWMNRDQFADEKVANTGGNQWLLAPGLDVRFDEHVELHVAPQFPVREERQGNQIETDFRATAALIISF